MESKKSNQFALLNSDSDNSDNSDNEQLNTISDNVTNKSEKMNKSTVKINNIKCQFN